VLNEKFIYTEMWVESGSEGESVLKALKFSTALPQYAVLDAEGNLIARYDRPNNVASMTPEGFASYLEDTLKKAVP
jgi:hypothetical protein